MLQITYLYTPYTVHHTPYTRPSYLKFKKVLAVRYGLGLVREGGGGPGGRPAAVSSDVQGR